jgi:hypothetical protein
MAILALCLFFFNSNLLNGFKFILKFISFKGVLLLYGQNMAMNHLIETKQLNIIKINEMIDVPTDTEMSIFKTLHLHVYHGNNLFSKFNFKLGEYDYLYNQNTNTNVEKAKYYALNMALKSKFIKNSSKTLDEIIDKKCSNIKC